MYGSLELVKWSARTESSADDISWQQANAQIPLEMLTLFQKSHTRALILPIISLSYLPGGILASEISTTGTQPAKKKNNSQLLHLCSSLCIIQPIYD